VLAPLALRADQWADPDGHAVVDPGCRKFVDGFACS
jgi:hypothetical protein